MYRECPATGIIMSGMLSMLCVILILSVATSTVHAGLKCDAVRPYFESQGFPATDIPKEAISCEFLPKTFFILKLSKSRFLSITLSFVLNSVRFAKMARNLGNLKIATYFNGIYRIA